MPKPINVFIIYAREDKEIKQGILAYLSPFVKPYNLVIWHDAHIEPGQEWKHSIDSRLDQTDLFLLLVSIDFINSQFIHQVEFKYAVERHRANKSIIIPVITRECPWNFIDFEFDDYKFNLSELQVLPDEGRPIIDWRTPDQAYNNIATGIRKVFASIKKDKEQQESLEKNQEDIKKAQIESDRRKMEEEERKKEKENEEESLWMLVVEESSVEGYQNYLNRFPAGKYKGIALAGIRTLENISKREQKNAEENLWKSNCEINTIVSYRDYLAKTKLGLYRDQANKFIAEIEKKNQEIRAENERRLISEQDNKLWKETSGTNTISSYKQYLKESKAGLFKEKAQQAIELLEAEQKEKEREQQFWQKAKTENTINIYNEYLQFYPKGGYRAEASNAIKEIEKKNQEIRAENERRLIAEQDNKLWKETSGTNTISSYKQYLKETEAGLFKEKAQQAIELLEAEQKEKEREQQFWQKAKTENTINIYNEYLQFYPKGGYRAEASNAIKEIDKKNQEIRAENEHRLIAEQDNKLWKETSGTNTISSYKQYLKESKAGLFKEKAQQAIELLEAEQKEKEREQQFWQKAKTGNTINFYNEYLQLYPTGGYRAEASNAIQEIEKKNQAIRAENERRLIAEQDNKLWKETSGTNTFSSYKQYLEETKAGLFKEKAQQAIEQLDAEQKEKEREQQFWQKAKTENTINIYNEYLQLYPKGGYRAEASAIIKNIEDAERQQQEMQLEKENELALQSKKKRKSKIYIYLLSGVVLIGAVVFGIMTMNPGEKEYSVIDQPDQPGLEQSKETEDSLNALRIQDSISTIHASIAARKESIAPGNYFEGGIIFFIDETEEHGLIVAKQDLKGTFRWADAEQECKNLKIDNFNDWRLPTKEELKILYQFYKTTSMVNDFSRSDYWSSTGSSKDNVTIVNFGTGHAIPDRYKRNKCRVRAVRAF